MLRKKCLIDCYIGVVPMGQVEAGRKESVVAKEPSVANVDRREGQKVAAGTCSG